MNYWYYFMIISELILSLSDGLQIHPTYSISPKFEIRPVITSGFKPYFEISHQQLARTLSTPQQHFIMNDITEAFRSIEKNQSNAHNLIRSMFNLTNPNPSYIFKLPLSNDVKMIIVNRNEFESPKFPNLTENYIKLAQMASKHYKEITRLKEKDSAFWFTGGTGDLTGIESDQNISDKLSNAVLANVVTEMNYLNYVKRMNAKGKKFIKRQRNSDFTTPPSTPIIYKKPDRIQNRIGVPKVRLAVMSLLNDEWKNLGLPGWEGEIRRPKYVKDNQNIQEIYYIDSDKNVKDIYEVEIPGDYGFLDKDEKNAVWDLPGKLSSTSVQPLRKNYNDENIKNMSMLLTQNITPEWPITNKRDAHKDDDYYIARANDLFGHSTKWKLKNSSDENATVDDRRKRGVSELYSMIKCSTGCDPLIYKGYGCYCGFMGSGVAVDGIDRCCKIHDKCYEHSNCPSYLEYFVPYLWKCYRGKPLCAIDHGEWGGPDSCADRLCKCDLRFAQCIRKFHCPRRRAVCRTSTIRMLQNFLMII